MSFSKIRQKSDRVACGVGSWFVILFAPNMFASVFNQWSLIDSRSNLVEIDNQHSRLASASLGQLLQYVLREDIPAGKLRAFFHQFDERVLSIRTNKGHITEVDDQLPTLKLTDAAAVIRKQLRQLTEMQIDTLVRSTF